MRFFDKIRDAFTAREGQMPPAASFAVRPDTVYAPVTGMLMDLAEVGDEIISGGLFGDGYAVLPVGGCVVYAPVTGRISTVTVTNHAIGLMSTTGIEVLIHVGVGTVAMDGRGFSRLVEAGQEVKAGEPILRFDTEAIRAAGHDDVITVALPNVGEGQSVAHIGESSTLLGGRPLVKVGDPLLLVKE